VGIADEQQSGDNEEVQALREQIKAKDDEIASLKNDASVKDERIASLENSIVAKDERLTDLNSEHIKYIDKQDKKISDKNAAIAEKDTRIGELTENLHEADAIVERLKFDNTKLTVEFHRVLERAEDAKKAHEEELERAKFLAVNPDEVIEIRRAHDDELAKVRAEFDQVRLPCICMFFAV
jgi:chromosome segregation ATPase